ncbi:type I restriction endonuclease subunit R|uniref:type I restriction endonuclease subunit R n=1 Tax=Stenotrophomonas sp. SbOxS2 TaxID=2723885 RepID=UPI0015D0EC70|nr:type I restriction endonuclease [Stenotrophomonas sp. SbOxS2]NYT97661.1 type I restriction endonuclease subunit R [Stenotrophomonas sp. SbOxS2]
MTLFNEDSRVKIPALLHLTRLGYTYISLKHANWDARNNIFPELFEEAVLRINPELRREDLPALLNEIHLKLSADDIGRGFHQRLTARAGVRLIDYEDLNNNTWHVVTELAFVNGQDNFRPDITLLVNGMPLAFVEVKKPLNAGGVLEERKRMDQRHGNGKYRHFFNLVQLMAFSNNMEYDDTEAEPLQGAFYAASTYGHAHFNHFREERGDELASCIGSLDEAAEDRILTDTNLVAIKGTPEYERNKSPDSPTHRLCTSLFSRERFVFALRYGFAWLATEKGPEKHVMRYPQLFATRAIADALAAGARKGIVWHTQGSGKTALAYFNVKYLTDWFQQRGQVARFYFIVDRIDLLEQAETEFRLRGLTVNVIASRDAFARDMKKAVAIDNNRGEPEITVVNIQKFKDDPAVAAAEDYAVNIQRVYFLDEVHRSYNPKGSFLANLEQSDRNAIKIGLTGTPLIGNVQSKELFGNYLHKYYYNASIADGYTLRLIREEIATRYKMQLHEALQSVKVQQGGIEGTALYAHRRFCAAMLDYILDDFTQARITSGDDSIGGMVICDSADQARELYRQFHERMPAPPSIVEAANDDGHMQQRVAEPQPGRAKALNAALILYDEGDKGSRRQIIEQFKRPKPGKQSVDLLFVYNMLLTGFDAPRLKKLYMGRVIKDHNLLQALTRVNRPYRTARYGYVVDFADIQSEFDKANKSYYDELNEELGDEMEHYSNLFRSAAEIQADLDAVKEVLFGYALDDAELFSQQVARIQDRDTLRAIVKALSTARELYNLIRLSGQEELLELQDFARLRQLHAEAQRAMDALNLKHQMEIANDTRGLLNQALEDIVFHFKKVGQAELKLADELKDILRRTREGLAGTQDPGDPKWLALKDELERLFKAKKLSEVSQSEMRANIATLKGLDMRVQALNNDNANLAGRYGGDSKLMRVHKRLLESGRLGRSQAPLHTALSGVKHEVDDMVLRNRELLGNPDFFERSVMRIVMHRFSGSRPEPDADTRQMIQQLLVNEYLGQAQGRLPF